MSTPQSNHSSPPYDKKLPRTDSVSATTSSHLPILTSNPLGGSQISMTADVFSPVNSQVPSLSSSMSYSLPPIGQPSGYENQPSGNRLGALDNLVTNINQINGAQIGNGAGGFSELTAIRMRRLPRNTSFEALRSMLLFAKNLVEAEFVANEYADDANFLTAIALFETRTAAEEAQAMLNGKPNSTNEANMIVEIMTASPAASAMISRRNTIDHIPRSMKSLSQTSPHQYIPTSRIAGRLEDIPSLDSAMDAGMAANGELPAPDSGSRLNSLFSNHVPAGNGPSDRPRISGKSVIDQDIDEDTGELLKDPVAYARNGLQNHMGLPRRSTNPQLPLSQFANLSLATNMSPPMQQFANGNSTRNVHTPTSAVSPNFSNMGSSTPYHPSPYQRLNYPPVNPADQNPPCNTLYVGNLPPDTSEDELKALFSRQRGYKRMIFRQKQNGPICFVEFEDVSFATKCLTELYGYELSNSVKGGIRLSFSKNPLGVRNGQPGSMHPASQMNSPTSMSGMNGSSALGALRFSTANGPPPGLSAPPGLPVPMGITTGAAGPSVIANNGTPTSPFSPNGLGIGMNSNGNTVGAMRPNAMNNGMVSSPTGATMGSLSSATYPDYMMGR